jgi:peptide-methionine (R)-S-oxide reductase
MHPSKARRSPKPTRSASGYDLLPLTSAERESAAQTLSPEERRVILNQGTEQPFCGTLLNNKQGGIYACRLCGLPLFRAQAKFESGTGWPSFYEPIDKDHVAELIDESHGMIRVEIRCQRCNGHLGHVFDDGPPPTRKRYCLNSVSMQFFPDGTEPVQVVTGATN